MTNTNGNFCIILCGGIGSRLWPYSLGDKPKQFLDMFGLGSTLLQLTYQRFAHFIPKENIYVSTYKEYYNLVREQLPDIEEDNIAIEPVQLGTAPSVALTNSLIYARDKHANIIVTPADQMIFKEDVFRAQVLEGLDFVSKEPCFLAMGVQPTHPETSYGYIQAGSTR